MLTETAAKQIVKNLVAAFWELNKDTFRKEFRLKEWLETATVADTTTFFDYRQLMRELLNLVPNPYAPDYKQKWQAAVYDEAKKRSQVQQMIQEAKELTDRLLKAQDTIRDLSDQINGHNETEERLQDIIANQRKQLEANRIHTVPDETHFNIIKQLEKAQGEIGDSRCLLTTKQEQIARLTLENKKLADELMKAQKYDSAQPSSDAYFLALKQRDEWKQGYEEAVKFNWKDAYSTMRDEVFHLKLRLNALTAIIANLSSWMDVSQAALKDALKEETK